MFHTMRIIGPLFRSPLRQIQLGPDVLPLPHYDFNRVLLHEADIIWLYLFCLWHVVSPPHPRYSPRL